MHLRASANLTPPDRQRPQELQPETFPSRVIPTPSQLLTQVWGERFHEFWRWMRLVGIKAALSCIWILAPADDERHQLSRDWQAMPVSNIHYILFSVIIIEMNRQERSGRPLDAIRVGHDLVYQFMKAYLRWRRTGDMPQLQSGQPLPANQTMLDYVATARQGLSTAGQFEQCDQSRSTLMSSTIPPSELTRLAFFPVTLQPGAHAIPTRSSPLERLQQDVSDSGDLDLLMTSDQAGEVMQVVRGILQNFSIPDTLGYALPGTAFLGLYADMQVPVQVPLPDVSDELPSAFHMYFYDLGSNVAVWSTLDFSEGEGGDITAIGLLDGDAPSGS
ncbi:hypothetical protein CALCODRAFT_512172 [Calocera cornea HHB12733]|uniref:Uncharacterized protein n=1 Tax=Calocera cornea HHB12733 TaxID=1353952 RepID=A0A165D7F1_9BASI|nr:hypothetical protein CALCODRAFT_512172 [Calocera cornea HHB12733]